VRPAENEGRAAQSHAASDAREGKESAFFTTKIRRCSQRLADLLCGLQKNDALRLS